MKRSPSRVNTSEENAQIAAKDRQNIALLLLLYTLQGIPLGMAASIPMFLQGKHVGYKQQAVFSLVFWPFSVKLLWAPIVDSWYITAIGRRKTWLVPIQYLLGLFMVALSYNIDYLLGTKNQSDATGVDIETLTLIFFILNFLAATQDIAVDGWALTILSKGEVGHASTCNSVGQTAGYFIGNVVFLALESKDFCNKYLRSVPSEKGIVSIDQFFLFWGIIFIITTTMVFLFKHEKAVADIEMKELRKGITHTYSQLFRILKLPAVTSYVLIILFCKVGFAATDGITALKLVEAGIHRETLALIGIPLVPLQILLPFVISKYTTGPTPLNVFLKAMPYRLIIGVGISLVVYWGWIVRVPKGSDYSFPWYYYAILVSIYAIYQITLYCMYVAQMAFHARVSDPMYGGTYMTLLNTVTNMAGNWPTTVALWLVDDITKTVCSGSSNPSIETCDNASMQKACQEANGNCTTIRDGYYIEIILCTFVGISWLLFCGKKLRSLQSREESAWKCPIAENIE
ncbi:uncharacterized protein TRIADDRAFT_26229 [Trichoplax adhaerens]|uniref:Acetyl-coenzyme A transporter 1 n=1 Tax=Trichoplax adhaerens TaxID=10228 RepID=B3RZ95_TRIAD|nr:hypothetical protein TRIADDRAFT_26229 [Trichoplax adhaerens]EDV23803.1 hypothetical protein TRIADDRAFT_26229 [Trichoplax adhaerens]|eukprot:XP_002113329.1 hypothetical protein TRIADDRAFT_26229 [Trichoplax adhaerens]